MNKKIRSLLVTDFKSDSAKIVKSDIPKPKSDETLIKVHYSSLNYKDALGITGKGAIYKKFPIIGGIDLSGEVIESSDDKLKPGAPVLVTGCGLGESHNGGYTEYACVPSSWVIPLPNNLSTRSAMILGTAGFTAGLSYLRMKANDQSPNMGPILVTGASGGVGQVAVLLFSRLGFEVTACSNKESLHPQLQRLGASQTIFSKDLPAFDKPLGKGLWGGAIDNVGGEVLAGILPHINLWGNVACIGLAGGHKFQATVMPHILRGVSLIGISSTNCQRPLRDEVWDLLAKTITTEDLDFIHSKTITMEGIVPTANEMINRSTHGRIVVKIAE